MTTPGPPPDPPPPPPPPPSPGARPGWYPDPAGRSEYRYHNGTGWTADVATDGQRYVDQFDGENPPGTPRPGSGARAGGPGNGIAIAALTCGIVSVALGWLPVVFVIGAVLAVLAIAFGIVGLRRSRRLGRRGLAIGGVVTGIAGVVMAVVGLVFTVTVFRALERYENPEPHTVSITSCEVVDGSVSVEGRIRNDGDTDAEFTVVVTVERPGSGLPVVTAREPIERLAAGATAEWSVRRPVTIDAVTCAEPEATGPLPFGVVPPD